MNKYLKEILDKMCLVVNAKNVDFKKYNWFMDYEWTEDKQEEFRKWLVEYLMKNKEARQDLMKFPTKNKKTIERCSQEFMFNYGFKTRY
jgi:hypothetical protein